MIPAQCDPVNDGFIRIITRAVIDRVEVTIEAKVDGGEASWSVRHIYVRDEYCGVRHIIKIEVSSCDTQSNAA